MLLPNIEIKTILYATDLSESARQAFAYAVSLTEHYSARLVIMHVLAETPNLDSKIIGYIGEEQWNQIKTQHAEEARQILIGKQQENRSVREALNQFCENAKAGCADREITMDEVVVKRGDPADQIVAQTRESNCDLIVMGRHGHGILDAVMGSTAQRVLRKSDKPVLLIRLPEE